MTPFTPPTNPHLQFHNLVSTGAVCRSVNGSQFSNLGLLVSTAAATILKEEVVRDRYSTGALRLTSLDLSEGLVVLFCTSSTLTVSSLFVSTVAGFQGSVAGREAVLLHRHAAGGKFVGLPRAFQPLLPSLKRSKSWKRVSWTDTCIRYTQ